MFFFNYKIKDKNFKKGVDFSALVCYTVSHSFYKLWKNIIHIVFGFAINNGRGAKAISNAKHFKGRLPGFARKELSPKLSEKSLVFRLLGQGKISFGLSLRWRAIIG